MRRIAFYSYDEHGLGHERRSIAIAHAISAERPASILLIAGAREAALFKLPEGTDTLALPAPGTDFSESLGVLRAMGTRLVLGLRDVLDDSATVRAQFERSDAFAVLRRNYDAIWVYGDPPPDRRRFWRTPARTGSVPA